MCKVVLERGGFANFTSVSNVFIDEYMPKANGEFVKIYLHLLRLIGGGEAMSQELSTEKIADKFNLLESDIMRALNYWCEQGLLSLTFDEANVLTGIKLENIIRNRYIVSGITPVAEAMNNHDNSKEEVLATAVGQSSSVAAPSDNGFIVPAKKKYSKKELLSFASDENLSNLTFLAQTYLGKTLSSSEINSLIYMLDGLSLDADFIEYIMEICISSNHRTLSYIEKQAVEYYKKGIVTVDEAKKDAKIRKAVLQKIYKIFGLAPKAPIKSETDYLIKWSSEYGFSDELILEACNRTMAHTHTGSFPYTDSILTNWFKNNAMSKEAVEKLDEAHSKSMESAYKPKTAPKIKKAPSFDQRTYDYDALERQLIANRKKKTITTSTNM